MPQVQVINRVEDPTVAALNSAGNDIAGTLQKQQALKLTGQYYKILAQNADTETEKAHLERLSTLTDKYLPQLANAAGNPAMQSAILSGISDSNLYSGNTNQLLHDITIAHPEIQKHYANVTGNPSPYSAPEIPSLQPDTAEQMNRIKLQQGQSDLGVTQAYNQRKIDYINNPDDPSNSEIAMDSDGKMHFLNQDAAIKKNDAMAGKQGDLQAVAGNISDVQDQSGSVNNMEKEAQNVEASGPIGGRASAVWSGITGGDKNTGMAKYISDRPDYAQKIWMLKHPGATWRPTLLEEALKDVWNPLTQGTKMRDKMFADNRADIARANAAAGRFSKTPAGQFVEKQSGGNTPPVGTIDSGYKFNGGDPSSPNSWEKVQ